MAVGQAGVVFDYLFTVSTSLQGVLIFVLFVARDPAVRAFWSQRYQAASSFFRSTEQTGGSGTRRDSYPDLHSGGIGLSHFSEQNLVD